MITFIVGTDTNCGKTHYGCMLAKEGFTVIKPIETGEKEFLNLNESDSGKYAQLQNKEIRDINKYFFSEPASPHLAAKIDSEEIKISELKKFINQFENPIVELAGGLMVPITEDYLQIDLIKELQGEVHLVVNNKLGAINHALLTIEALKQRNIIISKVYFNEFEKTDSKITEDNKRIILSRI